MLKKEIQEEIGFSFSADTRFEKRTGGLKIFGKDGKITVYYERRTGRFLYRGQASV